MKHIVKSAFLITVGGALPLLASVVLLIPYTDNLNTPDYGALAIYISFALLVQILMNYGVDSYLSVHYYDHHESPSQLRVFLSRITGGLFSLWTATVCDIFRLQDGFYFHGYLRKPVYHSGHTAL